MAPARLVIHRFHSTIELRVWCSDPMLYSPDPYHARRTRELHFDFPRPADDERQRSTQNTRANPPLG